MSSTGRRGVRRRRDDYPTPAWCVERLLDRVALPGQRWLEPSAGEGGIIHAVNEWRAWSGQPALNWTATEVYTRYRRDLQKAAHHVIIGDFRSAGNRLCYDYDVAIGNPPYDDAMDFIVEARKRARVVAYLLRLNFLGSEERQAFFRRDMPDIYQLPNRPTFVVTMRRNRKTGGLKATTTDSCEYGWFVWPELAPGETRSRGRIEVLDVTPAEVRAEWRKRAPVIVENDNSMGIERCSA